MYRLGVDKCCANLFIKQKYLHFKPKPTLSALQIILANVNKKLNIKILQSLQCGNRFDVR